MPTNQGAGFGLINPYSDQAHTKTAARLLFGEKPGGCFVVCFIIGSFYGAGDRAASRSVSAIVSRLRRFRKGRSQHRKNRYETPTISGVPTRQRATNITEGRL